MAGPLISIIALPSSLRRRYGGDAIRTKLALGTLWRIAAQAATQISRMLLAIGTARLLGKESFGQLAILQSTVGLFGTVAGLGLGNTILKHVAQHRSSDRKRTGGIIALGTAAILGSAALLTVCLYLCSDLIAIRALHLPHLASAVRLISVGILLNSVESAQTGTLFGLEAFAVLTRNAIGRALLSIVLVLAGAWNWGLLGAVGGQLASDFIYNSYTWFVVRAICRERQIPLSMSAGVQDSRILWTFSIPMLLTSIAGWAAQWAASAMLIRLPGGPAQMAVFQAGRQLTGPVALIPGALGEVGLPMLSNQYGTGDLPGFFRTLRLQFLTTGFTCVLLGGLLCVLSPLIMTAYGKDYHQGWPVVVIMTFGVTMNAVNGIFNQLVASIGKMWSGFVFTLGFGTTLTISAFALSGRGATGLAWAFLLAYAAHTALQFAFSLFVFNRTVRGQLATIEA